MSDEEIRSARKRMWKITSGVLNNLLTSPGRSLQGIVIPLSLTRPGNYQIHEFWLAEMDIDHGLDFPI